MQVAHFSMQVASLLFDFSTEETAASLTVEIVRKVRSVSFTMRLSSDTFALLLLRYID